MRIHSKHLAYLAVLSGLVFATVKLDAQEVTRPIVTYSGSWLINNKSNLEFLESLHNKGINHVILTFVQPNLTYTTANSFSGTGLQFAVSFSELKSTIEKMQQQGIKVLLAVGGATYTQWEHFEHEADKQYSKDGKDTPTISALVNLGNDLGVDGFDVDYEDMNNNVQQYVQVVKALRTAADNLQRSQMLTLAGWSVGASDPASSSFGSNVGRERKLFAALRQINPRHWFNLVSVMSYDGSDQYSPTQAFKDYKEVAGDIPLAEGLEVPPEGWGGQELSITDSDNPKSKVVKNQYNKEVKEFYSVESIVKFVKEHGDKHDGIMVWTIEKQPMTVAGQTVSGPAIVKKALEIFSGQADTEDKSQEKSKAKAEEQQQQKQQQQQQAEASHPDAKAADPTAAASDNPNSPGEWNAATAYSGGQKVAHQGKTYVAKWWTKGQDPATNSKEHDAWKEAIDSQTGTTGKTGAAAAVVKEWHADTVYSGGEVVMGPDGKKYKANHWTQNQDPSNNHQQYGPWQVIME